MATHKQPILDENENYKLKTASQDMESFEQLAAQGKSLETKYFGESRYSTEDRFKNEAFKRPQHRAERFLSVEENEMAVEGVSLQKVESTVSTDIKPSFLHFQGFLEALSGNAQLKYDMKRPRRGQALIFNNDTFHSRLKLGQRSGSDADTRQLKQQFEKLTFVVSVYRNLNLEELKRTIKQASSADHRDADSFVCAFLTHGDDDGIIYACDDSIRLQHLLEEFRGDRCPSLLGKPKIFIVQACRGSTIEVGVCEVDGGIEETDSQALNDPTATITDAAICTTVPAGADFLVCYSVVEGYYSFRDTISGSWYIQALCQALEVYGSTLEFTLLLTIVNRMVAEKCVLRCKNPRMLGRKQMPCFVSMLTKQLVFSPK